MYKIIYKNGLSYITYTMFQNTKDFVTLTVILMITKKENLFLSN